MALQRCVLRQQSRWIMRRFQFAIVSFGLIVGSSRESAGAPSGGECSPPNDELVGDCISEKKCVWHLRFDSNSRGESGPHYGWCYTTKVAAQKARDWSIWANRTLCKCCGGPECATLKRVEAAQPVCLACGLSASSFGKATAARSSRDSNALIALEQWKGIKNLIKRHLIRELPGAGASVMKSGVLSLAPRLVSFEHKIARLEAAMNVQDRTRVDVVSEIQSLTEAIDDSGREVAQIGYQMARRKNALIPADFGEIHTSLAANPELDEDLRVEFIGGESDSLAIRYRVEIVAADSRELIEAVQRACGRLSSVADATLEAGCTAFNKVVAPNSKPSQTTRSNCPGPGPCARAARF